MRPSCLICFSKYNMFSLRWPAILWLIHLKDHGLIPNANVLPHLHHELLSFPFPVPVSRETGIFALEADLVYVLATF